MGLFLKKKTFPLPPSVKALEEREKYRVLRLEGRLDASTVGKIQDFGAGLRAQKGYQLKHLLVDFTDARFIDSAAVAVLVRALSDYKKSNHKLGLVNFSENIQSILEITKVNSLVRLYRTEAEAIQDLEA